MEELIVRLISWLVSLFIALGAPVPSRVQRNVDIIAENIVSGLLSEELTPYISSDIEDGDRLLSLIREDNDGDAFFCDMDYSVNTSGSWRPRLHIQRAFYLTKCCAAETDPAKKDVLSKAVSSLMDYWIKKDYQSVNWWYNEIAMPNLTGQIAILGREIFSDEQISSMAELVGRGCLTVNTESLNQTGANATDTAISTIYYAVLTKNGWPLRKAVDTLSAELRYSAYEGLKRDGTFFQHGNRLYIGEYGLTFIKNYAKALLILNGSDYSFTEKQLEPLSRYITDGVRYFCFGNTLDPTVQGRGISRSGKDSPDSLVPYLRQLAEIDNMPGKDRISAFADSISGNEKTKPGLKYFGDAAVLVINNPDFYFSFRGGKKDLYYSETLNGENILSYNSSFPGVTTIMGTGDEYGSLAPVADYSLIPGTTAVYETDEQLALHTGYSKRSLPGKYLCAEDKAAAVASAQTSHEGIDMTVACFATGDAAILLGAGMRNDSGKPMITTVNQCLTDGRYTQDGNTVIHSGVKYTILEGGNAQVRAEERTGSYKRNNLSESGSEITERVFTLSFPCNGSYAYSVMGENTDAQFKVISNTEKLQAVVLPEGRIAAVFYAPGSFGYNGRTYRSLISAAVLYRN